VTPAQRRADALALLAESALAANFDGGTAGDRYQAVLHVNADDAADTRFESSAPPASAAAFEGVVEVDHGALYVSMETSQRLACDASLVQMRHDTGGVVLDAGRKTRTIPPSTRRALAARDTNCRFPGCTSRRCDAHHVHPSTPPRKLRALGTPAGPTAARRASTTWFCCVAAIIAPCTRADSA